MYKKLVKEYLKEQEIPSEQNFNYLFPNLKELDVKEFCRKYDPEENYMISVIIEIITNGVFHVIEYWEPDKSVSIKLNKNCSKEELDKYIKLLEDNGWTIDEVEDLYKEFEDDIENDKKQEILNKLQNYSYSELKNLIDKN